MFERLSIKSNRYRGKVKMFERSGGEELYISATRGADYETISLPVYAMINCFEKK